MKPKIGGILTGAVAFKVTQPSGTVKHAGIGRCLDFMAQNFCEPIQLKDLVRVSRMSRRGFCKAFRKTVGINPGAALRNIRIGQAKQILMRHDVGLKQIAERCGYRSENTFCVAFQRAVGMPPKKFQRQYLMAVCRHPEPGETRSLLTKHAFAPILEANASVRWHASNGGKKSFRK